MLFDVMKGPYNKNYDFEFHLSFTKEQIKNDILVHFPPFWKFVNFVLKS